MLGSLIVLGSIAVAITYAAIARDLDRRVAGASADLLRSHAGGGRAALLRAIHAHDITTTTGVSFALFAPDGAELAGRRDMPPPQLGWADVEIAGDSQTVRIRREMEAMFATPDRKAAE